MCDIIFSSREALFLDWNFRMFLVIKTKEEIKECK